MKTFIYRVIFLTLLLVSLYTNSIFSKTEGEEWKINWYGMNINRYFVVPLDKIIAYDFHGLEGIGTIKKVKLNRVYLWETYKVFDIKDLRFINLKGERISVSGLVPGDPLFALKRGDDGKILKVLDAYVGTEGDVIWCSENALLLSTGQKFKYNGKLNCSEILNKRVYLRINPLDWRAYYISLKPYEGYFFLMPSASLSYKYYDEELNIMISFDWGIPGERKVFLKVNGKPCEPMLSMSSLICELKEVNLSDKLEVKMSLSYANSQVRYYVKLNLNE